MKRCKRRIVRRWVVEAMELMREHHYCRPFHYWLHQSKGHYKSYVRRLSAEKE